MTIKDLIIEKLNVLPVHRQQEVLDFVEELQAKDATKTPLKSLRGLWADMNIHLTEEDIDENRRDMMRMSPREPKP